MSTAEIYIQAFIAILMIVNPIDPVKIVIFNDVVARQGLARRAAAFRVAVVVFGILGVSALVGRELLQLIGIDLGAFGVVGGLIVAAMGVEMLYGGAPSRAQGGKDVGKRPADENGLVLPLATPLMAGPGGITTVIAVSTFQDDLTSLLAAVVSVAVVSLLVFVGFAFLASAFARLSASAAAMLTRFGGLLLATIGVQLALSGLRSFYGF
ncbi:MarC family protein [Agromyces sp. SYSU T00266]|uniref:MarC family protein n=1 Tax=Agromyces zhanjiangensis TaxID=3158562 RepID=UPI00339B6A74